MGGADIAHFAMSAASGNRRHARRQQVCATRDCSFCRASVAYSQARTGDTIHHGREHRETQMNWLQKQAAALHMQLVAARAATQ
jgi:hypothetical protein